MFQCDCCRLLFSAGSHNVSSDFLLKFPTSWCKLPQCLVVSGHDPAVRMQSNLAIRLSVCLHACANTRRGRILFMTAQCSHSAGWQELCPVIDTLPCNQQVCEGSPNGLQHRLASQVTEAAGQEVGNELLCVSWHRFTYWNPDFLETAPFSLFLEENKNYKDRRKKDESFQTILIPKQSKMIDK